MTRIIGLTGRSRSGKDSAAQALVELGWKREGFADRLRAFLLAVDPLIPDEPCGGLRRLSVLVRVYGWERAKDEFPEVRELLQRTGTEAGRRVLGANVWVDALFADNERTPALVIPDVRFPNEMRAIQERGGEVIRIVRPGVGPVRGADGAVHESETALDEFCLRMVFNNGSLDDLHARMCMLTSEA